jgi:hypothetical protein
MRAQRSNGTILITRIGRGWLFVKPAVWAEFAAAVKRGEYDTPAPIAQYPPE